MKTDRIFGIHSVQSALDYSKEKIFHAWYDSQRRDQKLTSIVNELNKLAIKIEKVDRRHLDSMCKGKNHQGIVLEIELPAVQSEDQLKHSISQIESPAFFLVLDHVQDPHNFGACLRTSDAAGVHGVIITKDNAVGITPTVCKIASGAAETVPVYQVTNLARTLKWMKTQNIWIIGAAGEADKSLFEVDLTMSVALVVGAEEKGLRRLTREVCDLLVKLPMAGQVESLNLSVACGILLYETLRQRL